MGSLEVRFVTSTRASGRSFGTWRVRSLPASDRARSAVG